jgi:hemerythrin-like domain-containing protein
MTLDRRKFFMGLGGAGAAAVGIGLGAGARAIVLPRARVDDRQDTDAMIECVETPLEDLMQEHAVLERVLLIYEEGGRRLEAGQDVAPEVLAHAGRIVRHYIEDHHERDEEQHIFPRLERVGVEVGLIHTLLAQHAAGRKLTTEIISLSTAAGVRDSGDRVRLVQVMRQFIRMYRPHAARENTVLFPAFRKALSQPEYDALRESLERSEEETFGGQYFDTIMAEVVQLEAAFEIGELASFTPIR